MTTRPRVSVLVPAYNAAKDLHHGVGSVLAQTFEDWELVIADDGSTDETPELLARLQDPRIRVLANSDNRGVATRRNELAQAARGSLLALFDADDYMMPERLARQVAAFDADPELELLATGGYLIDAEGTPLGAIHEAPLATAPRKAIRAGWVLHPSLMVRRDWALANPYDTSRSRAEDHELWARVAGEVRAARLPEPLVVYRIDGAGTLAAHIRGWRESQGIYLRYGPAKVGWLWTLALVLGTEWLRWRARLRLAWGQEGGVVGRKRRRLSTEEAAAVQDVMAASAQVSIPGWETLGA